MRHGTGEHIRIVKGARHRLKLKQTHMEWTQNIITIKDFFLLNFTHWGVYFTQFILIKQYRWDISDTR